MRHGLALAPLAPLATLALLSAGCSSTGATPAGSTPAPVPVSVQSGGGNTGMPGMTLVVGGNAQTIALPATRDAIWPHLAAAYASLGIPLTYKDEASFRLGNESLKARRSLNGLQLRTALDCGSDLTGEKAETYEIRLTVESTIAAAGSGAELTTNVSGVGRATSTSGSDVTCSTRGEIERRIQRYVRTQLGLPAR
ncbi:MAG: hypothetical protein IT355_11515 [Gemmatimonadaceae bacterium]|nr:hypothetical protein [Gemmatimonadaceae bacterium]